MGSLDIGIDLGTTKIIIYKGDEGEILREPAVVAVNTKDDTVIAIGEEALKMLGKTPSYISASFPMANGVIANYYTTEILLKECIKRSCSSFLLKHRVIICAPSSITDVEKRAIVECGINCGARKVYLIDEPVAAAIGAEIDIMQPNGNMIIDIGGGTTDIAVISLGGVVAKTSLRYAGNRINEEIIKMISSKYKLSIGSITANKIKIELANIYNPNGEKSVAVKGRNLITGYPQKIELSDLDLYDAIAPFGQLLIAEIKNVMDKTPPELAGDIHSNGIVLTGGGALLGGLAELLTESTGVKVRVPENPVECVSIGTSRAFEFINLLQTGFSNETVG